MAGKEGCRIARERMHGKARVEIEQINEVPNMSKCLEVVTISGSFAAHW